MSPPTPAREPVRLVLYTTRYREGGAEMDRAARTLAGRLEGEGPSPVRCAAVETKAAFLAELRRVAERGERLLELHLVAHSGLYGPMFGTTRWPEQLSPHEWREVAGWLPLAEDARLYFLSCRSARWFAPFIARTLGVEAAGYHWYTCFSTRPDRFVPAWLGPADGPLHVMGARGRKSHGWPGAALKWSGLWPPEPLKRFEPPGEEPDTSYDRVAERYAEVFRDIRVRRAEWRWLRARLDARGGRPDVLDIGCGNGALLRQMAPRVGRAVGVDRSAGMLEWARSQSDRAIGFHRIDGPVLPFEDDSFDVVTSLLSFRYLDWDPLMRELARVLRPGGQLWVVDMVAAPVGLRELPLALRDKLRGWARRPFQRRYQQALRALVSDPAWARMLRYNPIRAEHELRWYLESRFPGRRVEVLDRGWHARVLAFDSGPFEAGRVVELSYP